MPYKILRHLAQKLERNLLPEAQAPIASNPQILFMLEKFPLSVGPLNSSLPPDPRVIGSTGKKHSQNVFSREFTVNVGHFNGATPRRRLQGSENNGSSLPARVHQAHLDVVAFCWQEFSTANNHGILRSDRQQAFRHRSIIQGKEFNFNIMLMKLTKELSEKQAICTRFFSNSDSGDWGAKIEILLELQH
ncbi:hypothetical protein BDQ12DRAFT_667056 [Crucibulum laeve]|uniref:Uncharacterized protein n=1 Tax=Crucibulum laeve TaxID=68775 RepID=A0A5C3LW21_9AGAR|nr:hypothetical protein BDQ12DRAFT_667056 [Crucibulum laeve]